MSPHNTGYSTIALAFRGNGHSEKDEKLPKIHHARTRNSVEQSRSMLQSLYQSPHQAAAAAMAASAARLTQSWDVGLQDILRGLDVAQPRTPKQVGQKELHSVHPTYYNGNLLQQQQLQLQQQLLHHQPHMPLPQPLPPPPLQQQQPPSPHFEALLVSGASPRSDAFPMSATGSFQITSTLHRSPVSGLTFAPMSPYMAAITTGGLPSRSHPPKTSLGATATSAHASTAHARSGGGGGGTYGSTHGGGSGTYGSTHGGGTLSSTHGGTYGSAYSATAAMQRTAPVKRKADRDAWFDGSQSQPIQYSSYGGGQYSHGGGGTPAQFSTVDGSYRKYTSHQVGQMKAGSPSHQHHLYGGGSASPLRSSHGIDAHPATAAATAAASASSAMGLSSSYLGRSSERAYPPFASAYTPVSKPLATMYHPVLRGGETPVTTAAAAAASLVPPPNLVSFPGGGAAAVASGTPDSPTSSALFLTAAPTLLPEADEGSRTPTKVGQLAGVAVAGHTSAAAVSSPKAANRLVQAQSYEASAAAAAEHHPHPHPSAAPPAAPTVNNWVSLSRQDRGWDTGQDAALADVAEEAETEASTDDVDTVSSGAAAVLPPGVPLAPPTPDTTAFLRDAALSYSGLMTGAAAYEGTALPVPSGGAGGTARPRGTDLLADDQRAEALSVNDLSGLVGAITQDLKASGSAQPTKTIFMHQQGAPNHLTQLRPQQLLMPHLAALPASSSSFSSSLAAAGGAAANALFAPSSTIPSLPPIGSPMQSQQQQQQQQLAGPPPELVAMDSFDTRWAALAAAEPPSAFRTQSSLPSVAHNLAAAAAAAAAATAAAAVTAAAARECEPPHTTVRSPLASSSPVLGDDGAESGPVFSQPASSAAAEGAAAAVVAACETPQPSSRPIGTPPQPMRTPMYDRKTSQSPATAAAAAAAAAAGYHAGRSVSPALGMQRAGRAERPAGSMDATAGGYATSTRPPMAMDYSLGTVTPAERVSTPSRPMNSGPDFGPGVMASPLTWFEKAVPPAPAAVPPAGHVPPAAATVALPDIRAGASAPEDDGAADVTSSPSAASSADPENTDRPPQAAAAPLFEAEPPSSQEDTTAATAGSPVAEDLPVTSGDSLVSQLQRHASDGPFLAPQNGDSPPRGADDALLSAEAAGQPDGEADDPVGSEGQETCGTATAVAAAAAEREEEGTGSPSAPLAAAATRDAAASPAAGQGEEPTHDGDALVHDGSEGAAVAAAALVGAAATASGSALDVAAPPVPGDTDVASVEGAGDSADQHSAADAGVTVLPLVGDADEAAAQPPAAGTAGVVALEQLVAEDVGDGGAVLQPVASPPGGEAAPPAESSSAPQDDDGDDSALRRHSDATGSAAEAGIVAAAASQPAVEASQPAVEASQPAAEASQPAAEASQPAASDPAITLVATSGATESSAGGTAAETEKPALVSTTSAIITGDSPSSPDADADAVRPSSSRAAAAVTSLHDDGDAPLDAAEAPDCEASAASSMKRGERSEPLQDSEAVAAAPNVATGEASAGDAGVASAATATAEQGGDVATAAGAAVREASSAGEAKALGVADGASVDDVAATSSQSPDGQPADQINVEADVSTAAPAVAADEPPAAIADADADAATAVTVSTTTADVAAAGTKEGDEERPPTTIQEASATSMSGSPQQQANRMSSAAASVAAAAAAAAAVPGKPAAGRSAFSASSAASSSSAVITSALSSTRAISQVSSRPILAPLDSAISASPLVIQQSATLFGGPQQPQLQRGGGGSGRSRGGSSSGRSSSSEFHISPSALYHPFSAPCIMITSDGTSRRQRDVFGDPTPNDVDDDDDDEEGVMMGDAHDYDDPQPSSNDTIAADGTRLLNGKYEVQHVVGEGAYGLVMKCNVRGAEGKHVAIKEFKIEDEDPDAEDVKRTSRREAVLLRTLQHPNVVAFVDEFLVRDQLYIVMEYVPCNLLELLEAQPGGMDREAVRLIMFQMCTAIAFIHSNDVVYRDIKPENVLVDEQGKLKLCDFGFARFINRPKGGFAHTFSTSDPLTDYVATRWYRAPELLLGPPYSSGGTRVQQMYGPPIDMWAIGCLMGELMDGEPLFAGDSDLDQLYKIQQVLGPITREHQGSFDTNPHNTGIVFNIKAPLTLKTRYEGKMEAVELDFLAALLHMDPTKRITGEQCLRHPYLADLWEAEQWRMAQATATAAAGATATAPDATAGTGTSSPALGQSQSQQPLGTSAAQVSLVPPTATTVGGSSMQGGALGNTASAVGGPSGTLLPAEDQGSSPGGMAGGSRGGSRVQMMSG